MVEGRRKRLSTEWTPSNGLIVWAIGQADGDAAWVEAEIETFRDYWVATGKPMVDWAATFRNWIRRALERKRTNGKPETVDFAGERAKARDERFAREVRTAVEDSRAGLDPFA